MVGRTSIPHLGKEPKDKLSEDRPGKGSLSAIPPKTPTTPLSPRLSKQTGIGRDYSITATVTVAAPASSTTSEARSTRSDPISPCAMAPTKAQEPLDSHRDPATQDFHGDIEVSPLLPSSSVLETAADLPVFDLDGKTIPFKSLYWVNGRDSKKVMIIFIRHFFCGNCQEYLRTLATLIPPSSLPSDTWIRVVGCGSHTLIPSYLELTKCPYPIFADPSKKLYSTLGMVRTLSLGNRGPDYIQHTFVSGLVKSIAQGLKRIGSGDALQAGDMRQVGGEFLFEVTGGDTRLTDSNMGNGGLKKLEVGWCHRMKNTRDHAELPELRTVLGLEKVEGEERRRRRSVAGWRHSGLARSLSDKRQTLSWSSSRTRSRSAGRATSHELKQTETVHEESKTQDSPITNGKKPAT